MLSIDKYSRSPIYEQVVRQFQTLIALGEMGPDDQLPSVRALSLELGVNPNTLQKAYSELEHLGLCYSVPGNGRFIAPEARQKLHDHGQARLAEMERLAQEMYRAGVTLEEMLSCVRNAVASLRPEQA